MSDKAEVLWHGEAFGQTRRLVQYERGISEQRLGADARWIALPGMPSHSTLGVVARELHKLQAAAVEYRAAIDRLERAHVRFETSYVELRQPAREALFEETRKAALAEANLAALLPPPADAEEPAP